MMKGKRKDQLANQEFPEMIQTIGSGILGTLKNGKFSCLNCISIDEILEPDTILVTKKHSWLTRPNRKEHQYCERHLTQLCMGHLW